MWIEVKKKWTALACALSLCVGLALPAAAAGNFVDVPDGAWYTAEVNAAAEKGYMTGVDSTHFVPLGNVTRATVITVLWRMEGSPAPAASSSFSDVAADAWYAQAIAWGKEKGIADGNGKGGFDPDRNVTRQELAVLLTRYDQYKGVKLAEGALNLFSDANKISDWAKAGMQHAIGMGWLEGSGGKINPSGLASRAQLAVLLDRMATPAAG